MKRFLPLASLLLVCAVSAQTPTIPPASRTVYKCEAAGKTVYSDAPCPGAVRVDVEPTRGLNKFSGKERVGHDVQKERVNEAVAGAMYPVLQETAEQRTLRHRRAQLKPEEQRACAALDARIAASESAERTSRGQALAAVRERLYQERLQHRQLRC